MVVVTYRVPLTARLLLNHVISFNTVSGADPGFEKGGDAEGSGARFSAYLGQFRGLFKEFGTQRGGRAPSAPPPPLDPRLRVIIA